MSDEYFGVRSVALRRAVTVLPLVLLSASWTVSVADVGSAPTIAAGRGVPATPRLEAPLDPAVPAQVAEPPASVAQPGSVSHQARAVAGAPVGAADIPSVALAAYQRAAAVIGSADAGCHLDWSLIAAIGRVESDHGRAGGSALDAAGVAVPAIVGRALDGTNRTALVSDTDAGQLDGDPAYDRAVGPLQFVPTTWGVVGVDGDNDGQRNPQDVDDAALAAAVYLCSGDGDLAIPADLATAVRRYNPSKRYVALVLEIAKAYGAGLPVQTVAAGYGVPVAASAQPAPGAAQIAKGAKGAGAGKGTKGGKPSSSGGANGSAQPTTGSGGAPAVTPHGGPAAQPVPVEPSGPLKALLTHAQAVVQCTLRGLTQLTAPAAFGACVDELTSGAADHG